MTEVTELYIDTHRKVVITKISSTGFVAIVDSPPLTRERNRYEEVLSFNEIDIVRRRLYVKIDCFSDDYRYKVGEEAVCLKDQELCTVISYTVNLECIKPAECEEKKIIDLIKCFASKVPIL